MWLEDHGITTLCHAVSSPAHTCPAKRTVQCRRQDFIELQSAMQFAYLQNAPFLTFRILGLCMLLQLQSLSGQIPASPS